MKNPHVHAELIRAWADGAEIEFNRTDGKWAPAPRPSWDVKTKYRVRPRPLEARFSVHRSNAGFLYLRRRPVELRDPENIESLHSFVCWGPLVTAMIEGDKVSWEIQ